jgi:tetratricopeptide (TPR) repeat protein
MAKGFVDALKTFAHNVTTHLKRVVLSRENTREALTEVTKDARKLRHSLAKASRSGDTARARILTEKGRKAYNKKNYSRAEGYFRDALKSDNMYALAYAYLGHTLYKLGQHKEATYAWRQALVADPKSEGAAKAAQKLRHLDLATQKTVNNLERNLE